MTLWFPHTFEEHISRLTEVLTRLCQAGLKLKPRKYFLFRSEIICLGHFVSKGIATDPSKTAAMDKYRPPKNVQELKQFIRFASYYKRFIPKFAEIASPLHRLTQVSPVFMDRWLSESLWEAKTKILKNPSVGIPKIWCPIPTQHRCIRLSYWCSAITNQDGAEWVIAYASRQLTKTER